MTFSYFVVVRVVCRSYFNNACTEFSVNIRIADNGDFFVDQRKDNAFSYELVISFIFRMYCNCSISEHCFRSCCSKFQELIRSCYGVFDMPEMSCHINMVYLCVRYCCLTFRTPVDKLFASVDITFVIETYKCFKHSL